MSGLGARVMWALSPASGVSTCGRGHSPVARKVGCPSLTLHIRASVPVEQHHPATPEVPPL